MYYCQLGLLLKIDNCSLPSFFEASRFCLAVSSLTSSIADPNSVGISFSGKKGSLALQLPKVSSLVFRSIQHYEE